MILLLSIHPIIDLLLFSLGLWTVKVTLTGALCSRSPTSRLRSVLWWRGRWAHIRMYMYIIPWDRLQSTESDVCRRQILTTKVDPRTVRIKIFLIAVDPYHRYANESEWANEDICDDSNWEKPFGLHGCFFFKFSALWVIISLTLTTLKYCCIKHGD